MAGPTTVLFGWKTKESRSVVVPTLTMNAFEVATLWIGRPDAASDRSRPRPRSGPEDRDAAGAGLAAGVPELKLPEVRPRLMDTPVSTLPN